MDARDFDLGLRVPTMSVGPDTMRMTATVAALAVVTLGGAQSARVQELVFPIAEGEMRYALSVPDGDAPGTPRPLVLALHPGGGRAPYYGGAFMRQVVGPALRDWGAIIVAPDAPTRSWTSATAERAVVALLHAVMEDYAVDRDRILVTGFSLGGRGTWFMATRHADLFTGAIPIAGSPGNDALDGLGLMPVHIIHSRDDEVMPFAPTLAAAQTLEDRRHPVRLTTLDGIGHFAMGSYIEPLRLAGDWMRDRWDDAGR